MKRIEDIEKMAWEELESASLQEEIPVPDGLEERIKLRLAAQTALEEKPEQRSFSWVPYAALKADAEKFVQSGHYELLMEAKDSGETVRMYTVGTETIVNGFVMLAVEPGETTFICLDGKMNRDDLDKLLADAMKE